MIFPANVAVGKLQVVKDAHRVPKLLALTKDVVVSVPVARCHVAKTCHVCVALQDPYCAWDSDVGRCTSLYNENEPDAGVFLQNVLKGQHNGCGPLPHANSERHRDVGVHFLITDQGVLAPPPSFDQILHQGVHQTNSDAGKFPERDTVLVIPADESSIPGAQYSTEELSMAVATTCVCALVIGFILGFLMARKCACGTTPDLDNPYHVPYLNQ